MLTMKEHLLQILGHSSRGSAASIERSRDFGREQGRGLGAAVYVQLRGG